MFKSYENEHLRAQVAEQRHLTIRIVVGALAGLIVLSSLIWSVTYYNVESLKVPVSYNHTDVHSTQYDRGGTDK